MRVNVYFRDDTLKKADELAKLYGMSRSEFLTRMINTEYLNYQGQHKELVEFFTAIRELVNKVGVYEKK